MATLTVPQGYGYVLMTASTSMMVCLWHGLRIGGFRKPAKIPYPYAAATPEQIASSDADLAKKRHLFNCAQRAHYNFLENYVIALPAMLVAGIEYPTGAAATGALWVLFRVMYAVGYTRPDKENGKGRLVGSGFWLCNLGLLGMVGKMGWNMVMN